MCVCVCVCRGAWVRVFLGYRVSLESASSRSNSAPGRSAGFFLRDCCVDWRRTHMYVSQTTRPRLRILCPSLDSSLADSAAATACGQMVKLGHQTPKLAHQTPGPALALRRPFVQQHLVGAPLQMPLALCGVATGVHLGPSMLRSVCPCMHKPVVGSES